MGDLASRFNSETFLGKLLRLPLRLIPSGMPLSIRSGIARGMIWRAGAHVHSCWLGTYERDKQEFCAKFVKPGMSVYDLGANAGFYTLLMSRLVGHSGRVVAFEPDSANMCMLRDHISLNQLRNVTVVQVAVAGATALQGFSLAGGATGRLTVNDAYLVPTLSLDEMIADSRFPIPNIIKIDVEGAEILVLAGAKTLISKHSSVWMIATHGSEVRRACLRIFSDAGYKLRTLRGETIEIEAFHDDEFTAFPGLSAFKDCAGNP